VLEAVAYSGAGGVSVKRSKSRAKRSSGVVGEAIEATTRSKGDAVEGTLCRQRRAPGIGGVEYLKHASGKNFLSVERAACATDIFIGGQMRDVRSLRCVAQYS
jgi:hypothetical protein